MTKIERHWFVWIAGIKGPKAEIWAKDLSAKELGKSITPLFKKELGWDDPRSLDELTVKYPYPSLPEGTKAAADDVISKVTLLDYTGNGHVNKDRAIDILLFTKNTRLTMSPAAMSDISSMSKEVKNQQLTYMANTIPSSWEFVDYTFIIEKVTRAFTHQFVRSRHCSFAQQTMRVLDVDGWDYGTGPTIDDTPTKNLDMNNKQLYQRTMEDIDVSYRELIASGVAIEDARGVLPTNILTNIVAKMNMRTFVELVRKRSSPRVQGEYRFVLEQMKKAVHIVHPWIDLFIERTFEKAAKDLENAIQNNVNDSMLQMDMIKLIDQMRSQS